MQNQTVQASKQESWNMKVKVTAQQTMEGVFEDHSK